MDQRQEFTQKLFVSYVGENDWGRALAILVKLVHGEDADEHVPLRTLMDPIITGTTVYYLSNNFTEPAILHTTSKVGEILDIYWKKLYANHHITGTASDLLLSLLDRPCLKHLTKNCITCFARYCAKELTLVYVREHKILEDTRSLKYSGASVSDSPLVILPRFNRDGYEVTRKGAEYLWHLYSSLPEPLEFASLILHEYIGAVRYWITTLNEPVRLNKEAHVDIKRLEHVAKAVGASPEHLLELLIATPEPSDRHIADCLNKSLSIQASGKQLNRTDVKNARARARRKLDRHFTPEPGRRAAWNSMICYSDYDVIKLWLYLMALRGSQDDIAEERINMQRAFALHVHSDRKESFLVALVNRMLLVHSKYWSREEIEAYLDIHFNVRQIYWEELPMSFDKLSQIWPGSNEPQWSKRYDDAVHWFTHQARIRLPEGNKGYVEDE